MSHAEHLAWCKQRAKECLHYQKESRPLMSRMGEAMASLMQDFRLEESTKDHIEIVTRLGMPQLMTGMISTEEQMEKFIDDFN